MQPPIPCLRLRRRGNRPGAWGARSLREGVIAQTLDPSAPILTAQVAGLPSHGAFLETHCPAPKPQAVVAPFGAVA